MEDPLYTAPSPYPHPGRGPDLVRARGKDSRNSVPCENNRQRRGRNINDNYQLPSEEGEDTMKIYYDKKVDALYIKLGTKSPDGVVELSEGINLDTTTKGKIIGIEILNASKRIDITTILSYQLELDKKVLSQRVA